MSVAEEPQNDCFKHDYFKHRLEDQIKLHDSKSKRNKDRFYFLQILIILFSASISVINALWSSDAWLRWVSPASSFLGGAVIVLTAIIQLCKYQESWIMYRATCDELKKEKYFYLNSVGSYSGLSIEQKERMLVEHVEALVSTETAKYVAIHGKEQTATGVKQPRSTQHKA